MSRPYHSYAPDQAFLLPISLIVAIDAEDAVHLIRSVLPRLNLDRVHQDYLCERGRPPFHPEAMAGLLLYGACRGVYSSRRLAQACRDNVAFMYLMATARPDFRTISSFRKRFQDVLEGLFVQVLGLCQEAGLVKLGHVSLDGTKVRANASKHKAMTYGRMVSYHRDEPPGSDPAPARSTNRWPHRNRMRERLLSAEGKALYKLRKQTVEPVIGQMKSARGFRQFLRRGRSAVQAEWALACTATNLLKLWKAWQPA
jgi:transposase